MYDDNVTRIFSIFAEAGHEAYIVGGAVRNYYLKSPIKDIDFAVSCEPKRMLEILEAAEIRTIPTGLAHGTVTALIGDVGYEMTSFRKDVQTDGRHAVTEFGGTMLEDAQRRDFTINALYLDADRNLHDPIGMKSDLENRVLRFVGDSEARVQEDYLRILRFFRFLSQYELVPCPEALMATEKFRDGLMQISAERIGAEMKQLMAGAFAKRALDLAADASVINYALEGYNSENYAVWYDYSMSFELAKDWRVETVNATPILPHRNWSLSNRDFKFLTRLQDACEKTLAPKQMGEKYGEEIALWALYARAAKAGLALTNDDRKEVRVGAEAVFPLKGGDLLALGISGEQLGKTLSKLKSAWRRSDYQLDKERLLALIGTTF